MGHLILSLQLLSSDNAMWTPADKAAVMLSIGLRSLSIGISQNNTFMLSYESPVKDLFVQASLS